MYVWYDLYNFHDVHLSGMFEPFFFLFLFLFPGVWIKVVIAGAGAAILDHKVEVLYWGWESNKLEGA